MKLLENIVRFADSSLEKIGIDGREYRTLKQYEPSAMVGAAFGKTSCNKRLAQAAHDAQTFFDDKFPVILQKEIYDCYIAEYGGGNAVRVGTDDDKGIARIASEVDTRSILISAGNVLDTCKLDRQKLIYVAHPAHMYRVMEVGKNLGLKGIPFVENRVKWSDADDLQRWTTASGKWALREVLTRMHHKYKGYVK